MEFSSPTKQVSWEAKPRLASSASARSLQNGRSASPSGKTGVNVPFSIVARGQRATPASAGARRSASPRHDAAVVCLESGSGGVSPMLSPSDRPSRPANGVRRPLGRTPSPDERRTAVVPAIVTQVGSGRASPGGSRGVRPGPVGVVGPPRGARAAEEGVASAVARRLPKPVSYTPQRQRPGGRRTPQRGVLPGTPSTPGAASPSTPGPAYPPSGGGASPQRSQAALELGVCRARIEELEMMLVDRDSEISALKREITELRVRGVEEKARAVTADTATAKAGSSQLVKAPAPGMEVASVSVPNGDAGDDSAENDDRVAARLRRLELKLQEARALCS
mmetsp:Transcript_97322/g.223004  ORF Transcript_97322/g.223004 Transcript_97322/m.223004 type:complete len:336 (-) Transcript_97322:38-1045(-)